MLSSCSLRRKEFTWNCAVTRIGLAWARITVLMHQPKYLALPFHKRFFVTDAYSEKDEHRTTRISTLRPTKLVASDLQDFSRLKIPTITYSTYSQRIMFHYGYDAYDSRIGVSSSKATFPEGTVGFLYYHTPTLGMPSTAGDVRFRLVPSKYSERNIHDSEVMPLFSEGKDLTNLDGIPWRIPLFPMISTRLLSPLLPQLLEDGLIDNALIQQCKVIMASEKQRITVRSRIVFSLHQPFPIHCDTSSNGVVIIRGNKARRALIRHVYPPVASQADVKGYALFQFEPSPSNDRIIQLRCIGSSHSVQSNIDTSSLDQYHAPVPGEFAIHNVTKKPWSVNVDDESHRRGSNKDVVQALRLLVDGDVTH